ncbi:transcriptional regulator [Vibrio harveyi]|uniref:helix-turn-helix domain-containing protein n=1 Tax=Vibrio harveyi TaxID=669 RepID=UPI003BB57FCE
MGVGKKIKAIRVAEGLSQPQMSQLVDIPVGSLRDWEQERGVPRFDYLTEITKHERFEKYAFWLMTDKTLPESGQIAPDFSILLECGVIDASTSEQKRA